MKEKVQPSHSISLYVNNKPGVLNRIALVFSRRGFNIDSLVVSPSLNAQFSRMSITASGDRKTLDQIIRQLNKLVDVIHAIDHTGDVTVERELMLIKMQCTIAQRTEILQIVQHFRAFTVDISDSSLMIQATGASEKLDALIMMMQKYKILELVRTGKVIMTRGASST